MKTLRYAGYQPGASGFGWATCNANLRAALGERFSLVESGADIDFIPIMDHALNPCIEPEAKVVLGYTFFESPLQPEAPANAARYGTVFCGSSWNKAKLAEAGITNTRVLMQGVDGNIFHPLPPRKPDGKYRIFSGGKCEYRKGQDLAVLAFLEFIKTNPDAHLVCAWHNPWPDLIHWKPKTAMVQDRLYKEVMLAHGVPSGSFTILPKLTAAEMAAQMHQTDIGLFPNRCEGGTNLVAMEYMTCGKPIVANAETGHADLWNAGAPIERIECTTDAIGWADQQVNDIVRALTAARERTDWPQCPKWTWDDAAQVVADDANA